MSNENSMPQDWHKQQAIELFNETWDLMDKKNRTDEEIFLMIHMAHASRFHWTKVGTLLNIARGEWQISRVYALLGMGEPALLHGHYSLDICLENGYKDFDLAFGYEAVARAAKILGEEELFEMHYAAAEDAALGIEKEEDKTYFLGELKTILSR